MTIEKQMSGTTLTMTVEGRVDTQPAPQLEAFIKDSIADAQTLILDFAGVSYISSAGLRTVLNAQNWMDAKGGSMEIHNAAGMILNVFKITGFDTFLTLR